MVLLLDVDPPNVVVGSGDVSGRIDRRDHGVVLIVVAVLAIATDELQVGQPLEIRTDHVQALLVVSIVDGVGLWHPDDNTVDHVLGADQSQRCALLGTKSD